MKKRWFIGGGIVTIILLIVVLGGVWLFQTQRTNVLGVVSPLAEDEARGRELARIIFDRTSTSDYPPNDYFPKTLTPTFTFDLGETHAYAVMDRDTGELLLAHNLTQELPIASVTKIMTALVALDRGNLNLELPISAQAAAVGEATMGLTAGEVVRMEDLLYGLLLPSGNDAAETLAEGLGGRTNFIVGMNEKAQDLGLFDTYYFNPTGLDGDTLETTSFSTALDLLALTNYALTNPIFAQIVSTHYWEVPYRDGKHKYFPLYNILQLDWSYPGIKGVKPGVTDFAHETLVSYIEKDGRRLIVVLLGTKNSRDEVVKLYDFVFQQLGNTAH